MNADEIFLNMILGDAEGKDPDLIKADAIRELRSGAHGELMNLADAVFKDASYPGSLTHITHEMITNLELVGQETNYLLRAILTALTTSVPTDDLFDQPLGELEQKVPEPA